jgi:uncharacterized protein
MSIEPSPQVGLATRFLLALIAVYQRALSPVLGSHCRYLPTCSAYAAESIRRFGAMRGLALALTRVGRCHPFHVGGFDPVLSPSAKDMPDE